MKEKIINWAIDRLLDTVPSGEVEETLKKRINTLMFKLYKKTAFPHLLDREVIAMAFNARYTEDLKLLGIRTEPSKVLTSYYLLANKGDNSFMKEPFYRVLSQNKDNEVRRLLYRLKRTQ